MKKNLFLPLLALIMIFVLVGCKKEPVINDEPTTPPVEQPVAEVDEDEKEVIMNEFNNLLNDNKDPDIIISYINKNVAKLGQLEGDKMIDALEISMNDYLETLTNKLFASDKDGELMGIAGLESYFPKEKIGEIKNAGLKAEVTKAYDSMYKLVNLEGEFYPIIDYSKLKSYDNNISDEWKEYLAIQAMDSDNIPFSDGGIRITFEDLGNRILKTENFLNSYIDGNRQDEVLNLYENKLTAYMKGLPNTPISDPQSNRLISEVLTSYKESANMEGYVTANIIYQYMEVIKANNSIIDNKVLTKADELIADAVSTLREYK
jgi:hypothetical protein